MNKVIDYHTFYKALDVSRRRRNNMAWHKVAARAGVTPSVLANFVRQYEVEGAPVKILSLESFVALLQWMNKTNNLDEFLMEE